METPRERCENCKSYNRGRNCENDDSILYNVTVAPKWHCDYWEAKDNDRG